MKSKERRMKSRNVGGRRKTHSMVGKYEEKQYKEEKEKKIVHLPVPNVRAVGIQECAFRTSDTMQGGMDLSNVKEIIAVIVDVVVVVDVVFVVVVAVDVVVLFVAVVFVVVVAVGVGVVVVVVIVAVGAAGVVVSGPASSSTVVVVVAVVGGVADRTVVGPMTFHGVVGKNCGYYWRIFSRWTWW